MPQLDLSTYLVQYVWFSAAFLLFYLWMTFEYLPALKRTFGLRAAYTAAQGEEGTNPYGVEQGDHETQTSGALASLFGGLKAADGGAARALDTWSEENRAATAAALSDAHAQYVAALAYTAQTGPLLGTVAAGKDTGNAPAETYDYRA